MRIFALFDDPDAIQRVRDDLEKDGRGDEVVEVIDPRLDRGGKMIAPVMGGGQSISGPAVVNQAGQTAPSSTGNEAVSALGSLNLPEGERAAFEQAMRGNHAQLLVMKTNADRADATQQMLRERGAELVATS